MRRDARLYKRGRIWWCSYYDAEGIRRQASTQCTSIDAAERVARELERRAHTPADAAPHPTKDALDALMREMRASRSGEALRFYETKAGHVLRLLGEADAARLTRDEVLGYLEARVTEGAARSTVKKELSVLSMALKLAEERGFRPAGARSPIPRVRSDYRPRRRFLSPDELGRLLDELPEERRWWVLLAVYSGARLSELEALEWRHLRKGWIQLPGRKTARADRVIPLERAFAAELEKRRGAASAKIVGRWGNNRRDLRVACIKARVDPVTPNDLRRTFASWLAQGGVSLKPIATMLGHTSTRMVDLVYGHLDAQTLARAVETLPKPNFTHSDCNTGVTAEAGSGRKRGERRNPAFSKKTGKSGV